MKTKILLVSIFTLFMIFSFDGYSQIKDPRIKVKSETNNRLNKNIDNSIDKSFNKVENGIKGLFKKKKKKNKKENNQETKKIDQDNNEIQNEELQKEKGVNKKLGVVWSKFDFIPGDEVIFEDAPSSDEENGEFPSRWDAAKGNAEIVNVEGEPAIIFPQRTSTIIPYLKNSKEDYLPEVFTIEFDCYFKSDEPSTSYKLILADTKNQRGLYKDYHPLMFVINDGKLREFPNGGATDYLYKGANNLKKGDNGIWRHISLAYTKGKLKIYMDEVRLINIPHYSENPLGVSIETFSNNDEDLKLVKNFRIAKGGVKYYDRVLSDGKIIVNGIRFDVNEATIKPESNGPINKIFQLMQKQTDLNFSVEGHTDSDGDDARNQSLSEQRAKAVMDRLISMGISDKRLTSAGWGESKPINENTTAEGKANNRRVEFVKK